MPNEFVDFGITPGESLEVPLLTKGDHMLQAVAAEVKPSKSGNDTMLVVQFEDPSAPEFDVIYHNFLFPRADLKPRANQYRKAEFADFTVSFSLPLQFNIQELKSLRPRGWVTVGHEEYPQGSGKQNARILKFLRPPA